MPLNSGNANGAPVNHSHGWASDTPLGDPEVSGCYQMENNAPTSDTRTKATTKAVSIIDNTGAIYWEAVVDAWRLPTGIRFEVLDASGVDALSAMLLLQGDSLTPPTTGVRSEAHGAGPQLEVGSVRRHVQEAHGASSSAEVAAPRPFVQDARGTRPHVEDV